MSDIRTTTLAEVIQKAQDGVATSLRVALPGRIESFNPATQLASVKPLLKETYTNEDDEEVVESLPVVHDVPVQFPGAGAVVLTFPVTAGDYCLLIFTDRSLDHWLDQGGEVDPVAAHRHTLTDAVALLGFRPLPGKLASFDAARLYFGKVSGPGVAVDPVGNQVHLGVNPGQSGDKNVACVDHEVEVTIPIGTTLGSNGGGPLTTTEPITITGKINEGSPYVKAKT